MPSTRTSGSTNQRNAHRRKRLRNHADGSEENALPGLRSNQQRGLFQYEDPRPKPEQAMRKYAYATLCGTLLFSGKAAFAIETSLLDRLAQERIIGDGQARPQAYPVPAQPGSPRAASPAQAPSANAELVGQLRQANEQLQELEQKLAAMEQGNALLIEQLAQRQAQGNSSQESSAQAVEQAQNQARIRELGQRLEDAQAQKRRPSGRTRQRQDGNGRQRLPRQRAQRRPGHSPNRDRQPETTGDGPAGRQPAAQGSATEGPAGRATGQDGQDRRRRPRRHQRHGAQDVRVSYAVGAWYAESAPQRPRSSPPSARSWTCRPSRRDLPTRSTTACSCPGQALGRTRRRAAAAGNRHAVQE